MTEADNASDLSRLAKGGRQNVGGFLLRLAARVPFLFVAGRVYGPEALGRMAFAIVVIEFAAQLATMGLKRGLALHVARDPRDDAHNVWDAVAVAGAVSAVLTVPLLLYPEALLAGATPNPFERWVPLIVGPIALTEVMLAALAYRFDVATTVRARAIVEPWAISIAAAAFAFFDRANGLLAAYVIAMFAAFLTALVPFLRAYPMGDWRPSWRIMRPLATRNLPLAGADAIEWGSRRIDLAILGLFAAPAIVGIYYVAQQLASLPQKLKTSFDPVLAPVITRNLADGDRKAIAAAISQVGFWILAAQAGVALTLGIPGEAIMGTFGKAGVFVSGNGALAFLLLAEVIAATAVVSEHALVYIAPKRNLAISAAALALQAGISFALLIVGTRAGWPPSWIAAMPAVALCIALAVAAVVKALLAQRLLGAPIRPLRLALFLAAAVTASIGGLATLLPEWTELAFGIPAMLGGYAWVIWRWGFEDADRALFRRNG